MFNVPDRLIVKSIKVEPPKIYITPDAYITINEYVKQCNYEISWFSSVEEIHKNGFVITDAMLLTQEVTGASAEFSETDLSTFMNDILKNKGIDFYNKIKCWGHSHVNFAASPSGQDLKQIRQFNEQDYYIMLIVNKKGDAHVAFYDFKNNTIFENVPIHIYLPNSGDISKQVKQSIGEKVKLRSMRSKDYMGGRQLSMDFADEREYQIVNEFNSAFKTLYDFFKAEGRKESPYEAAINIINDEFDNKTFSDIAQRANHLRFKKGVIFNVDSVVQALKSIEHIKDMLKIECADDYEEWQFMRSEALLELFDDEIAAEIDPLIYAILQKGDANDIIDTEIAIDEYISLQDIKKWCVDNGIEPEVCNNIVSKLEELQEGCLLDYREIILTLCDESYFDEEEVDE